MNKKLIPTLLLLFLPAFFPSCSCGPSDINYWVATNGSDSATGTESDPFLTIEHARDVLRTNSDRGSITINVNIKEGNYRLTSPITFTSADSGTARAHVVYQAAPGAVVYISGAERVTNWTVHDAGLNIWKAQVTTNTMPRQLYVNGTRATRARTPDYPNYYTPTSTGYSYLYILGTDPQIPPTWNHPELVEAITATQWKMMRCPVERVDGGANVIMQDPCWTNANVFPTPWNFHLLSWLENAYEFLDEKGEWYLDPYSQTLYYIPLDGQDMLTADVELPVLEKLVDVTGDSNTPVSYIDFKSLDFEYATWLGPNTSNGYVADQSSFYLTGTGHSANIIGHDPNDAETPGNVSLSYVQHITFLNNTFAHLGGIALNFGTGSQNNEIVNNTFNDISSSAIKVGGINSDDSRPTTSSQLTSENHIANNLIQYVGQDYYDVAGIYLGFTTQSLVEHNEIDHVPWSGIAIGWGWGLLDPGGFVGVPGGTPNMWGIFNTPSASQGNQILNNKIQYFLEKLWDGGAIYSLGAQGTSFSNGQLLEGNVAMNKRAGAGGNTFYTDAGSRFNTFINNVSLNNPLGYVDFGPCLKASSFETLCLLTGIVPYGADMGGCVPRGDEVFENNYLRDNLTFYDICTNTYNPNAPTNMVFTDNYRVSSESDVPSSILSNAGRQ